MKLIDEQMGSFSLAPITRHPVKHGVGDDKKPHGFELTAQIHDIVHHNSVLGIHVGFM